MTNVILITGTPGTGKSTLARNLSDFYDFYNIFDLAKEFKCVLGFDDDRNVLIIDDDCVFEKMGSWLAGLKKSLIIIEGHYSDIVPKEFTKLVLVLHPSIEVLRPRLISRGYELEKIDENIEAHIMKECYYDALEYYGLEKVLEIIPEEIENLTKFALDKITEVE